MCCGRWPSDTDTRPSIKTFIAVGADEALKVAVVVRLRAKASAEAAQRTGHAPARCRSGSVSRLRFFG